MAKITTLESERINQDLYIYLVQHSKKKFIVSVMDDVSSEKYSSHSRIEQAQISFDKAVAERVHLRMPE